MKLLTQAQYEFLLRHDLASFAGRCFQDLNPQTCLATNWHLELIAAKLTAVREGRIRRLIINLPPRHLKSLLASIAFPAWCLGPRLLGPDPVRQLRPRTRRQARPRLSGHHDEPVVSADLSDPPGAASPGRAGIHHYPPGLSARHLDRRRADRTRNDMSSPAFLRLLRPREGSKWTR